MKLTDAQTSWCQHAIYLQETKRTPACTRAIHRERAASEIDTRRLGVKAQPDARDKPVKETGGARFDI